MASTEYIKSLAEYLKGHFAKQKTQIADMRKLRALLHEVKISEAHASTAQVVRTPILADMIQRIVATLTVNYPTWQRGVMGDSTGDQNDSTLIERWIGAAHQRMEIQARRRTFRMLMDAAIADGMAVAQYTWNPKAWTPFPEREKSAGGRYKETAKEYLGRTNKFYKQADFPFGLKDVDPLAYHFWDSYNGEREVLIIEDVPLAPTASALGVYRDSNARAWVKGTPGQPLPEEGITSGDKVKLVTHHTKNSVTYTLDDEKADEINHNWGRLGIFDFAGLSTHERAPERSYLPVAFAFAELIPFLDRLLTMKANWMYLAAFPRGILKLTSQRLEALYENLGQNAAEKTARVSENLAKLDALITLEDGESFEWASPPPVGRDLNELIQLTMGLIDTAGIGQVMRGQSPTADSTGYLANQLMTAARLAYDPITDNAKFMLRDGAAFMLYGVDKLAKTAVPVWGGGDNAKERKWLELSSKHLDGIYDTEPKLEPLLPSNFIMEGQFGLEQVKGGAISMYTHRSKFMHLDAPEEEEKLMMIQEIKNDPRIKGPMIEKAMKEAGLMPPPPNPAAGLVGPNGMPLLGPGGPMGGPPPGLAAAMPRGPGMGMPLSQEMAQRQGVPALPQGAPAPGNPGGNFGQRVVVNAGE